MGGSTLELVFLAVFGLVTLFQFVRNYLRGKAAKARQARALENAQSTLASTVPPPSAAPLPTEWGRTVEEDAVEVSPPVPLPAWQLPQPPRPSPQQASRQQSQRPAPQPRTRAPAHPAAASSEPDAFDPPPAASADNAPYPRRRARRFSRAALMGDRRAVQDAVVLATILRPCHAHKPHGVDG